MATYQFVNDAKSRLQHERWVASCPKPDAARTARALAILDRDNGNPPDPGDELPEGYVPIRFRSDDNKSRVTE